MKKIISLLLTITLLVSVSTTTAFAVLGSDANIDAAKEAVNKATKTNYATNDITMEEYLKLVRSFIPKSLEVEVDYSPYGNFFQCKNATEEKDGKVKAQFRFYHKDISLNESDEYITFKIKKLEPVTSNEEVTAPVPAPAPSTSTGFADVADNAYYAEASCGSDVTQLKLVAVLYEKGLFSNYTEVARSEKTVHNNYGSVNGTYSYSALKSYKIELTATARTAAGQVEVITVANEY